MATILGTIKAAQSGMGGDGDFDDELIIYINQAIAALFSLGVTEFEGVDVDKETSWPVFSAERLPLKQQCIGYILKDVRLNFDVPNSTNATNNLKDLKDEILFRIQMEDIETINDPEA